MTRSLAVFVAIALTSFAPAFAAQPAPQPDRAVSAEERAALVKGIFAELRSKYVFPERLDEAIPALEKRWSDTSFAKLSRQRALVDRVNRDLLAVFNDKHLFVLPAEVLPSGAFDDPENPDPKLVEQLAAFERLIHYGVQSVEVLPGNVGYLRVRAFAGIGPGVKQAYADAMGFVRDTDALIVDVRENGGGDGLSVAELVGYFLEKKTLLQEEYSRTSGKTTGHYSVEQVQGPKYGTKRDVFVLTSEKTFSAAEEFAYDLQTQKRATIIGESTGGGANHNRFVRVAEHFALSVPFGTVKNAVSGTNWEAVGVKPDLKAKADDAQKVAHRLAIERQLQREQDPERKRRLEQLLATLQP